MKTAVPEFYRKEIQNFALARTEEEKEELYEANRQDYDYILFPSRRSYEIIRIPTLPYPEDYLSYLVSALMGDPEEMDSYERELLVRHGILEKIKTHYQLTKHGEEFLEVVCGKKHP